MPIQPVARNRRDFLKMMALGGFFFSTRGAFAEELTLTPAQTLGPYYPDRMPLDPDNDLLVISDAITPAVGEVAWITGRILDRRGDPVRGALVEIWQADINGAYIHTGSTIRNRDAGFQGYGRFLTGSKGEYVFRTIKAGIYPGRTRHVHFAVTAPGQARFVTQLYEAGLALNNTDGVLNGIRDAAQRNSVIVPWNAVEGSRIGEVAAKFDVVLGFTPPEKAETASPAIYSLAGVANAASFVPATTRGSRLAIFGHGFGTETAVLQPSDIVEGALPVSMAGVSVEVNGAPAAMLSVSPEELVVLAPDAVTPGAAASVKVANGSGVSDAVEVEVREVMPSLYLEPGGHLRAFRAADGMRMGPAKLIDGEESRPAKPGDEIVIVATGLRLEDAVTVRIHTSMIAGVMPEAHDPGNVLLRVTVPALEDGDYGVALEAAGVRGEKSGRLQIRA